MIEQYVGGANHYTFLRLIDISESFQGGFKHVTGSWKHTNVSYNNQMIMITHDHPRHLKFTWVGGPQGGVLNIGSLMGRGSHRADETEIFSKYITLYYVKRQANGEFQVGSVLGSGVGDLKYNVNPHFNSGDISWSAHY